MNKIFFLFFFISQSLFAQKHDYVWTFGYNSTNFDPKWGGSNINFNTNPPDTDYVKRDINFQWNCASICDENGQLLFYTNGCKIFNKNNVLTENGSGLNPSKVSDNYCSRGNIMSQGSLFLPHPTDTNLYYLFHLRPQDGSFSDNIYYTLLDKTAENGNGIVLSKNNVILEDTMARGKLTAVRHGNGRDWWILMPRMFQNKYIKLLLTDKGIKGPFFQNIGMKNENDYGTGQSVFSPDGTKYIHFDRLNDLNVFDFDRCSGELSNPKKILLPSARDSFIYKDKAYPVYTIGGVAVSPNSKYLYVTTQYFIYQYNLKNINIDPKGLLVAKNDTFKNGNFWTSFYLPHIAPDNKIYINCTNSVPFLHVINNPDEEGLACNITQHSFRLPTLNAFSIPNFPNFRLGKIDKAVCETPVSVEESEQLSDFVLYPNPASNELFFQYQSKSGTFEAQIFDVSGRLLMTHTFGNQNNATLNISTLKQGFYIINILERNQIIATKRFVKID